MRYYVACLHTAPLAALAGSDQTEPAGYILTERELREVGARAGGAPLTYEHSGVREAVDIIGEKAVTAAAMHRVLADLAKTDPTKAAVGNVLSAFIGRDGALWCIVQLDELTYPRIAGLITGGLLLGVSLTHICQDYTCVEVALTRDPARPGATIRFGCRDLAVATLYANAVKAGTISSTIAMDPSISDDLSTLPPAAKLRLEARLGEIAEVSGAQ